MRVQVYDNDGTAAPMRNRRRAPRETQQIIRRRRKALRKRLEREGH
jgi:hypothetical protein